MTVAAPLSQKADTRPISFVLDTGRGAPKSVGLVIRPEDLTVTDPSRISIQQTLSTDGGAWADSFGPGLQTINLSGHTGWRRTEGSSADGETRFRDLNEQCFTAWHAARKSATASGDDPNNVKLIYADALDNLAVVVAPMSFTLRRSRSRPLLCQFQISMTVLSRDIDMFSLAGVLGYLQSGLGGAGALQALGLDSLTASVNRITSMIGRVQSFINANLITPIKGFLTQTARLYGAVQTAIRAGSAIAGQLISVAQMTAQAGVNLFRTLAAVAGIPSLAKSLLMQVAGAYSNIFCVLKNALKQPANYQDYSSLYGSSNCSSTSGGRPVSAFADQNPFFAVAPTTEKLPVTVTNAARAGITLLAGSDPVLAPMSTASIGTAVTQISGGLAVA